MESLSSQFIVGGVVLLVLFTLAWLVQRRTHNAGIVDAIWAVSFPVLVIIYFFREHGYLPRQIMIVTMVSIWGLRLASYLYFRTVGRPEDGRYSSLRTEWGDRQALFMLRFFYVQAILALFLSLPFALIIENAEPGLTAFEWTGAGIWVLGVLGESVADQQLKTFKANPSNAGNVCTTGLWKYSRHPNYFFEWTIWVAYFITALGSPWGFISIVCPMVMLYILLRVTGIPYTEKQIMKSRKEAYIAYQETTSSFLPLPPKKRS